ncbi:hypothetical protein R9X47_07540 [Wukongibacter baidiensis]|uniref:hypothetical protein n=1 Tax=Wukongibacter baidiensis TaxID=1723361 RepID=UPI003D7FD96D
MSRFLGPIHHWLFNKIKLYEGLESDIIEKAEGKLSVNLSQITEELKNKVGAPIEDKPLEELIDTNNIHGWLQNKITIAETRQAALITFIVDKHGKEGIDIVKECYKSQAIESGEDAKSKYDLDSAPLLYKALNNYILDGMPCDNVNNITINEDNKLEWKVTNCLHKNYWLDVNGDLDTLYELRKVWISNFVSSANPSFTYNFISEGGDGNRLLIHQITKSE